MITGAHAILYSTNPEADRAFFRDILGFNHVDVGEGWLIFALPPAEVAVHPSETNDGHELYLICDDVDAFVREMRARNIACTPVQDRRWGLITELTLPGGGTLGVYESRHPRPAATARVSRKKSPRRGTRRTHGARNRRNASRTRKRR